MNINVPQFQVQEWLDNDLNPADWGWDTSGHTLTPVPTTLPPAPDSLLRIVACASRLIAEYVAVAGSLVNSVQKCAPIALAKTALMRIPTIHKTKMTQMTCTKMTQMTCTKMTKNDLYDSGTSQIYVSIKIGSLSTVLTDLHLFA